MTVSVYSAGLIFAMAMATGQAEDASLSASARDAIQRLGNLGAATCCGRSPRGQLFVEAYRRIFELGTEMMPALGSGLTDSDVLVRRQTALLLGYGKGWFSEISLPLGFDPRRALPALVEALNDEDLVVRAWSAGAIGWNGLDEPVAVAALAWMLADPHEEARGAAASALRMIGPGAMETLPALREALSDPVERVRQQAQMAIEIIEGRTEPLVRRRAAPSN